MRIPRHSSSLALAALLTPALVAASGLLSAETGGAEQRTVTARVQARPGGPVEEIDMAVHEAPVDPPTVSASEAQLEDDELVLGVVADGTAIAYPIRYLATTEVMNDRVGDTAMSPTW